ncbi:hypothetical protein D5086_018576 [Populus alba]|uniref:Uncharacterized protein n=1 Tax=Populus alba TaxID=43335 RepID=A0ACC4BRB6_POPAL
MELSKSQTLTLTHISTLTFINQRGHRQFLGFFGHELMRPPGGGGRLFRYRGRKLRVQRDRNHRIDLHKEAPQAESKESVDKASENSHKLEEKETRAQFQETTSLYGSSLSTETVVESSGATFAALMFVFTWLLKKLKSVVGESGSDLPLIFPTKMAELTQEKSVEGTESGSELSSESLILAINYEAISEPIREDFYTFYIRGEPISGRICIKFRFKRSIFPHASLLKSKRSSSLRILH